MNNTIINSLIALVCSLLVDLSFADTRLRESDELVITANSKVYVIHEHQVTWEGVDQKGEGKSGFHVKEKSRLTIFNKTDSKEVLKVWVPPLTNLVNIEDSKYFAGLSNLKALSRIYNFVLFTQDGKLLAKALITSKSGHCESVRESTTNSIRWFDERSPIVKLEVDNGKPSRVIVMNPYDTGSNGKTGQCIIEIERGSQPWPSPVAGN